MNKNPWLYIPLSDYEGHMSLPSVLQAQFLSNVFKKVLKRYTPKSIAIIGCAGGNGYDYIDCNMTKRVVSIDINKDYIKIAKTRYGKKFESAEFISKDIQNIKFSIVPVDIIYAALVFEYVDIEKVFKKLNNMLSENGLLVTVLQLPSHLPEISKTPFKSLKSLSKIMKIVNVDDFKKKALKNNLEVRSKKIIELDSGKLFEIIEFKKKGI
jgi:ubiquinone/menaquinone biosynthesis C-methylase UbiE